MYSLVGVLKKSAQKVLKQVLFGESTQKSAQKSTQKVLFGESTKKSTKKILFDEST